MITKKIEKLEQMANFEGDVRDGNIGAFSQGVVVGERNASKLALEVLEEITNKNVVFIDRKENEEYMKRKKPPYIYNPSTNEFLINIKKEIDDYEKGRKHHIYFFTIIAILVIILLLI